MPSKDIADLMRQVEALEGWRVENLAKTWKVWPPDGGRPISVAHGPRNAWRTKKNTLAKLRRAGAPL